MDDAGLLKRYEPILCFAGEDELEDDEGKRRLNIPGESFFPTNLEDYLSNSRLMRRARAFSPPVNRNQMWHDKADRLQLEGKARSLGEALLAVLADFDEKHYLQFIKPEDREAAESARRGQTEDEAAEDFERRTLGCLLVVAVGLVGLGVFGFLSGIRWLGWAAGVAGVIYMLALITVAAPEERQEAITGAMLMLVLGGVAAWAALTARPVLGWITGMLAGTMFITSIVFSLERTLRSREKADHLETVLLLALYAVPCLYFSSRPANRICLAGSLPLAVLLFYSFVTRGNGLGGAVSLFQTVFTLARRRPLLDEPEVAAWKSSEMYKPGNTLQGRFTYYARVVALRDSPVRLLQYFYFYPYNDWSRQGGWNAHEGDWEAAFVFGQEGPDGFRPTHIGLSQHHGGIAQAWPPPVLHGETHPVIFPAAGSHANFFEPQEEAESIFKEERPLTERLFDALRPKRPSTEFPNGRGQIVGVANPTGDGREAAAWTEADILPRLELPVVEGEPPAKKSWLDFRGLWGDFTGLTDFSGPTSPRWKRPLTRWGRLRCTLGLGGEGCIEERFYWRDPAGWLKGRLEAGLH